MSKSIEKAEKIYADTHSALQVLWDNVNKGQKKQLAKIPEVKAILDRYNIEYEV